MTGINSGNTREREESRIVATWLQRLGACVPPEKQSIYEQALRVAGVELSQLRSGAGLAPAQMDTAIRVVREHMPDIILLLFTRAKVQDLGLIGYAALNCATLGEALRILYEYQSLARGQYQDRLYLDGDDAVITPTPLPGHVDDYIAIAEDSFSGNWSSIRDLLGARSDSREIRARFDYEPPSHVATYFQVLGPHCEFNADVTELRFPRKWLDESIVDSGFAAGQVIASMCDRVLGPGGDANDTAQRVQTLLLSRPGRRLLRLEEAADELRLSAGQLRKRLYRAGHTYKQLVLRTRMELARHYLVDTNLSVQEVAYLLDYSSAPPFSRAFKKYHQVPPEHFRLQSHENAPRMDTNAN